jgi:cell division protein FtsQ
VRKLILALGVTSTLALMFFYDSVTSYLEENFPFNKIQVEAPFIYVSKHKIEQKVLPELKHGFFLINKSKTAHSLEKLSWVDKATVKRVWPDVLIIKINERRPIAKFNKQGLVDDHGEVFFPKNLVQFDLPQLIGEQGSEKELLHQFKKMSSILSNVSLSLNVLKNEPQKLTLIMKDGLEVVMSKKQSVSQLKRFVTIYPKLAEHRAKPLLHLDLRYRHGLAVRWKD